ncbi:(2E,6E)-farnesyl diphosphate synthase [hydrothermal vent metagenome]|uniref:(2E,6E)-farnesyl diphosphate synthase n=1 Tax=hydrothermal vent metagenome TaxID=652676 RepID=A0A3B1B3L2_9ZZZZ
MTDAKQDEYLKVWQKRTDNALHDYLPNETTTPASLHKAMRYAVLNGGKRIRPLLAYATGHALGVEPEKIDAAACAVELIHAYSLVHDDLPAMDDDDLRRGKPTCHKVFGDAEAILAGDALQSLAFHLLAHKLSGSIPPRQQLQMIDTLAIASGSRGMAGGQSIDLNAVGKELNIAELENMHIHKTGALIRASVKLGALCTENIENEVLKKLDHFAKGIGLAFQIRDDILDVEGDTKTLGKPQGSDIARNKPTYPALLGLDEAREMADELYQDALNSLSKFGKRAIPLQTLSRYIVQREY